MRRQFSTRIAVIFGLWAAALGIVYTILLVLLTQATEDRLTRDFMSRQSQQIRQDATHQNSEWVSVGEGTETPDAELAFGDLLPDGFDPAEGGFQQSETRDGEPVQVISLNPDDPERLRVLMVDPSTAQSVTTQISDYVRYMSLLGLGLVLATALVSFIVGRLAAKPLEALSDMVSGQPLDSLPDRFADRFGDGEVGKLAGALEDSLGQTREALERERAFNHGVSHELRSSLQIANHALELIGTDASEPPDAKAMARLKRSIDAMQGASEAFLWLSRPDVAGIEPTSIAGPLKKAVERLQTAADTRDITVSYQLASPPPEPALPEAVIEVVVANLLRNAITHSGGSLVTISVSEDGVDVCDDGKGLPAEERQRINRGDAPERIDGVGLGLVLCRRLCERFGGRLSLHPAVTGQGTIARWKFRA
jgi:signal transduction histidine kinase